MKYFNDDAVVIVKLFYVRDVTKREFQHEMLLLLEKSAAGKDRRWTCVDEATSQSSGTVPTDYCVIVILALIESLQYVPN